MSDKVWITNNSGTEHSDGHAGFRYDFPVSESVEIPADAAAHIFGHGADDKSPYLARLGWARTISDLPKAAEHLAKFEISDEPPVKAKVVKLRSQ